METKGLKGKGRLREGAESYSPLCLGLDLWKEMHWYTQMLLPGIGSQHSVSLYENPTALLRGTCSGSGDSDFICLAHWGTNSRMPGKVTSPGTSELMHSTGGGEGASPPGVLGQRLLGAQRNQSELRTSQGSATHQTGQNTVCFGMLASKRHNGSLITSLGCPISFTGNRTVPQRSWAGAWRRV